MAAVDVAMSPNVPEVAAAPVLVTAPPTDAPMSTHHGSLCVEIRTVQAAVLKTLVECLKELLTDSEIQISQEGVKLVTMDSAHVILVHAKLDADRFEHFYCECPRKIGLNLIHLHKIIRTVGGNDTVTLFVKKNDQNFLGIEVQSRERKACTTYKLQLLDLDEMRVDIPNSLMTSAISMPSSDFQKLCRDAHALADAVELKVVDRTLVLSARGDFCSQETVLHNSDTVTIDHDASESEIVQGVFSLKHLCLFTKATNLSKTVDVYLKNDFPVVVAYHIATLGTLKLALCPKRVDE
jgi:proliferating cell nuclear antigen